MDPKSRLTLNGFILDFNEWAEIIYSFVEKFYKKYNVYPNILLASDPTFNKISFYAQIHLETIFILEDDGSSKNMDMDEYSGVNRIVFSDCILDFCIDYEATLGNFILMWDQDPDFSGEPIPEEEEKKTITLQFKKIA